MPGLPAPNSSDCSTSAFAGSTSRVGAAWDEYTEEVFGASVVLGAAMVMMTGAAVTVTTECVEEDATRVELVVDVVDVD